MQALNLPEYDFKIKSEGQSKQIFDFVRKKYVALTPEEWVRQNFVAYLVHEKGFPASLMAIETKVKYGPKMQRADVVIYGKTGKPRLIVECKAPSVQITQEVFYQIARYNMQIRVDYLIATNGLKHYICKMDYEGGAHRFLKEVPGFGEL